ncbi:hypothetical protein [Roseicyclus persicicus]|uniref:Uncharacterized protein n=1 Tax=Roseicyclus persicicus TaxID=2650661 RepID=A0A7X6JXG4_9RHOB|nr:hypothetical protein [Roseibacterium persicicum]NKX43364.1 hypothetical protein [Roseibacterium persicicum]
MTAFRFLYILALALTVFALFVLWVWTGPVGVMAAAMLTHGLLRLCERQGDAQAAEARKAREDDLARAFRR